MKAFDWDDAKNLRLKAERGISFEEIVALTGMGHVLDVVAHPNPVRYGNRRMFVLERNGYAWIVPFVESEKTIFLKTAIPSRKATHRYLDEE